MLMLGLSDKRASSLFLAAAELLVFNSVQFVNAALPSPRWGHAAALLKNNLYIFGGKLGKGRSDIDDISQNTNELLILDISKSFSVSDPTWISRFVGPNVAYHTLSIGGPQNELLVLYGGEYSNVSSEPLFYYNTSIESPEWNNAGLSLGTRRREHTAVTRLNDSMNYFFGGIPDLSNITISAEVQFQDLFKLDTIMNLWNIQNPDPNTPSGRFHHTATILSDNKMYVIGGYSNNQLVDISQIYVYDTVGSKWSVQTATGTLPPARRDHAAVGTHDGKVIIHGGVSIDYIKLYDDVAVLDTTQTPYTWSIVGAKGNIPPARYSHTATMVGTNMIVAFGYLANDVTDNNIYSLDTTTYTWNGLYTPNSLSYTDTGKPSSPGSVESPSPDSSGSSSSKAGIIAGSVIGIFLLLFLIGGAFWFYRIYRRRKQDSFYAAPYSSTKVPNPKKSSGSVELSRQSMGSTVVEPVVETSEDGKHKKDYTALLEERMMNSDIQQTSFVVIPKSQLRVTNPDEGNH